MTRRIANQPMPKASRSDSTVAARDPQRRDPAPGDPQGPRTAADHLFLHPDEIVLEGPYVRQHVDPAELEALKEAIQAGGEVQQAVGVRTEGTAREPRYVLVYGMRRWLASRAAGLERIPVRDHGRISVADSLALQVTENEARVDPHPVDTAVSYQLLVQEGGMSQAEIARVAGRSAAHVSYMRAVGEAILRLDEPERAALYHTPEATVPRFQKIAPLDGVEERVEALRSLLRGGAGAPPRGDDPAATAKAGPTRGKGSWSLRVSYQEDEVRRDPELAQRLERFLEEQLERLRRLSPSRPAEPPLRGPVTWEIDSAE